MAYVPVLPPLKLVKALKNETVDGRSYERLDTKNRRKTFNHRKNGKVKSFDMTATFACRNCDNEWNSSKALLLVNKPPNFPNKYHAAVFQQDCYKCNGKGFMCRIVKKEIRRIISKLTGVGNAPRQRQVGDKSSRHVRCDACRAGYHQRTISGIVSIDKNASKSIQVDRATASDRRARMEDNNNWRTLYHQTSQSAARSIVNDQKFLRGRAGAFGAGIYFAEDPAATDRKAHAKGVILKAKVFIGSQKNIGRPTGDCTFQSLLAEDYDSVYSNYFASGPEYVVFNYDQARDIEYV